MKVAAAIVALVVAAGVSACGGSGERNGASGSSSPKRDIQPEAQQRAESILLQRSDFPDEWRASAPESDRAADEEGWTCMGSDFSTFTVTGEAVSKTFTHEDTTEASSDSTVAESEDQAEGVLREISDGMNGAAAEDCVRDLWQKWASEDESLEEAKIGEVSVGELNVAAPSDVAETKAWRIFVEVEATSGEAKGLSIEGYLDYVVMRNGDCIAGVQTSDAFTPFDSALRNELLQTLADRMSDQCSPSE